MKLKHSLLSLSVALALCAPVFAEKKHDHDHEKKMPAPNGGRLLTKVEPHVEFLVLPDRKVQISFVNDDGKVVAPGTQEITVTAGSRSSPTKLAFAKSGNALVSDVALPAGNDFPAVVQIREKPGAKAVVERFNVNLTNCPDCKKAEYACSCEGEHKH